MDFKEDLILIEKAMNLEMSRYKTYIKLSSQVFNREVKEILNKLAKVEKKHYDILKKQVSSIKKFKKIDLNSLKKNDIKLSQKEKDYQTISRIKTDIDVMREAEEIEKGDVEFYSGLIKKTKSSELKKIFRFLKKEEAMHIKIIREKLKKLRQFGARVSSAMSPQAVFYDYTHRRR